MILIHNNNQIAEAINWLVRNSQIGTNITHIFYYMCIWNSKIDERRRRRKEISFEHSHEIRRRPSCLFCFSFWFRLYWFWYPNLMRPRFSHVRMMIWPFQNVSTSMSLYIKISQTSSCLFLLKLLGPDSFPISLPLDYDTTTSSTPARSTTLILASCRRSAARNWDLSQTKRVV